MNSYKSHWGELPPWVKECPQSVHRGGRSFAVRFARSLFFHEAYFESRKKVTTVTHLNYLDVENSMKIQDF